MAAPEVRSGQGNVKLSRPEFERRFRERFYDPAFDPLRSGHRPHGRRRVDSVRRVSQKSAHETDDVYLPDPVLR